MTKLVRLDIKLGTPVCEMSTGTLGQTVGVTNAYCIYRLHSEGTDAAFSVAPWRLHCRWQCSGRLWQMLYC